MKVQGIDRNTLPWKAPWQPYTAWFGGIGSIIITLVAGFPVFLKGNWKTADFVASYVGIPIFIVPIIAWKLYHRTKVRSLIRNLIYPVCILTLPLAGFTGTRN
jgi:yeast amino acid transporter